MKELKELLAKNPDILIRTNGKKVRHYLFKHPEGEGIITVPLCGLVRVGMINTHNVQAITCTECKDVLEDLSHIETYAAACTRIDLLTRDYGQKECTLFNMEDKSLSELVLGGTKEIYWWNMKDLVALDVEE